MTHINALIVDNLHITWHCSLRRCTGTKAYKGNVSPSVRHIFGQFQEQATGLNWPGLNTSLVKPWSCGPTVSRESCCAGKVSKHDIRGGYRWLQHVTTISWHSQPPWGGLPSVNSIKSVTLWQDFLRVDRSTAGLVVERWRYGFPHLHLAHRGWNLRHVLAGIASTSSCNCICMVPWWRWSIAIQRRTTASNDASTTSWYLLVGYPLRQGTDSKRHWMLLDAFGCCPLRYAQSIAQQWGALAQPCSQCSMGPLPLQCGRGEALYGTFWLDRTLHLSFLWMMCCPKASNDAGGGFESGVEEECM